MNTRIILLALAAAATFAVGTTPSSAQVSASFRVGSPPPPMVAERRWAPPYSGAVWIAGHHEWIRGRWVWVGGYYAYPPHPRDRWIPARWYRGNYYPGHWAW